MERNRGSSVIVVSGYGLGDWAIELRFPAKAKSFSSSRCVQTGSGVHPASCPKGNGGPFPGGKARPGRDAEHSAPSSAEVVNEYELLVYLISPLRLHRCVSKQLYLILNRAICISVFRFQRGAHNSFREVLYISSFPYPGTLTFLMLMGEVSFPPTLWYMGGCHCPLLIHVRRCIMMQTDLSCQVVGFYALVWYGCGIFKTWIGFTWSGEFYRPLNLPYILLQVETIHCFCMVYPITFYMLFSTNKDVNCKMLAARSSNKA
jgi:hypothetical protein